MMKIYLVTTDFHKRKNKDGAEYGMPVSVLMPPEVIWGYDVLTAAYTEEIHQSWLRICDRVNEMFPQAKQNEIIRLIGKEPQ